MTIEDPLLDLLSNHARRSVEELSAQAGLSPEEVNRRMASWESDGTIVGYQAVINQDVLEEHLVAAFIEVKITPERGGGFDRLAMRIARFDEVDSCYLASGGYDLLVVVEGRQMREIARFVHEKLATLDGVVSTATRFRLKTYKEKGFLFQKEENMQRLAVSP